MHTTDTTDLRQHSMPSSKQHHVLLRPGFATPYRTSNMGKASPPSARPRGRQQETTRGAHFLLILVYPVTIDSADLVWPLPFLNGPLYLARSLASNALRPKMVHICMRGYSVGCSSSICWCFCRYTSLLRVGSRGIIVVKIDKPPTILVELCNRVKNI
jgi:hypothetical protein